MSRSIRIRFRPGARVASYLTAILLLGLGAPVDLAASALPDPGQETGSRVASFRGFPRQVISDLPRLFSGRSGLLLLSGAALTAGARQIEDPDEAADFLQRGALDPISDVGNVYGDVRFLVPLSIVSWVTGRQVGSDRFALAGRDAFEAIGVSLAIVGAVKFGVDRERPNGDRYSFPSGHAATTFTIAPVVHKHLGNTAGFLAYSFAILTGMGRMEDRFHYMSDVVAGTTIGLIVGHTIAHREDQGRLAQHIELGPNRIAFRVDW